MYHGHVYEKTKACIRAKLLLDDKNVSRSSRRSGEYWAKIEEGYRATVFHRLRL